MCIAILGWQLFADMPVLLLSNRDEFYQRPTLAAHQWSDLPIYAGRDQHSGGTWLGIHQQTHQHSHQQTVHQITHQIVHQSANSNRLITLPKQHNGRWAAVLNFRDGVSATEEQVSRGRLVTDFLCSGLSPLAYARQLELIGYAGFNLLVGDDKQAVLVNNRGYPPTPLYAGLHVLSNGQPNSAWFKCERLRARVRQEVLPLIAEGVPPAQWQQAAWTVLSDTTPAPSVQHLPDTGMPETLEMALSAICIDTPSLPDYGTRTQSILTLQPYQLSTHDSDTASVRSSNASSHPSSFEEMRVTLLSRSYPGHCIDPVADSVY